MRLGQQCHSIRHRDLTTKCSIHRAALDRQAKTAGMNPGPASQLARRSIRPPVQNRAHLAVRRNQTKHAGCRSNDATADAGALGRGCHGDSPPSCMLLGRLRYRGGRCGGLALGLYPRLLDLGRLRCRVDDAQGSLGGADAGNRSQFRLRRPGHLGG